ncbi:SGNH hydrolase [Setomelanomma holmii]|uniref:SGNH hydrolase n=1 Tax=Setomelanomma holmii TaxID=210430 RepID=A0A9P4HKJ9_9PLEO|nr:SGNH hydrolase [Setomelanomma holmii]
MRSFRPTVGLLTVLCLLLFGLAVTPGHAIRRCDAITNSTASNIVNGSSEGIVTAEKPLLRIMPLGASLTQGFDVNIPADLRNGYRRPLREELRYRGYPVDMVGTQANGDFIDRQHEGYPGLEVDQVATKMITTLTTQKPNLVTLLLGTNDCNHARSSNDTEYARGTKSRMKKLLEKLYSESDGITIILATLPSETDTAANSYIEAANAGYRELVKEFQGQGGKIELAEMYTTWFTPSDRSDSIHFKNNGYRKMAALFAEGFSKVKAKGWLIAPILDTGRDRKFIHVGDWDGDGLCDVLAVDRETGNVEMWRNTYKQGLPTPTFANPVRVVDTDLCPQADALGNLYDVAVRFGDLDGDERVDYICTSPSSHFDAYLNTPSGLTSLPAPTPPEVDSSTAFARADFRWADVNGDGRADLLHVDPHTSNTITWINNFPTNSSPSPSAQLTWSCQPTLFPPGLERGANMHFPRLSKSGRADLHVVYPQTGTADTWFNEGNCGGGAADDGGVKDPELPVPPEGV